MRCAYTCRIAIDNNQSLCRPLTESIRSDWNLSSSTSSSNLLLYNYTKQCLIDGIYIRFDVISRARAHFSLTRPLNVAPEWGREKMSFNNRHLAKLIIFCVYFCDVYLINFNYFQSYSCECLLECLPRDRSLRFPNFYTRQQFHRYRFQHTSGNTKNGNRNCVIANECDFNCFITFWPGMETVMRSVNCSWCQPKQRLRFGEMAILMPIVLLQSLAHFWSNSSIFSQTIFLFCSTNEQTNQMYISN